jgi:hypothetical protein
MREARALGQTAAERDSLGQQAHRARHATLRQPDIDHAGSVQPAIRGPRRRTVHRTAGVVRMQHRLDHVRSRH